MFWFFGHEACGILDPWPGMEPALPELEGKVLTTGPPGKSLSSLVLIEHFMWFHFISSIALSFILPFKIYISVAKPTFK